MIMIVDDYEDIGRRLSALEGKIAEQPTISPAHIRALAVALADAVYKPAPDFRSQYAKACREMKQPR